MDYGENNNLIHYVYGYDKGEGESIPYTTSLYPSTKTNWFTTYYMIKKLCSAIDEEEEKIEEQEEKNIPYSRFDIMDI